MELNTYITPSNNEFKERIRETRYMSYNNVLSDEIKMLMDIDIVRDLANRAMYINNQLPYDVASLTARQIYLGEPITGIEIPLIEEEEDEIINDNEIIIEEPIFEKEEIIDDIEEEIISEEIISDEIIDEVKEEIIDDTSDELEKTFDLSNMLSELPVGMLDEIPNKNMLDELPIGDEINNNNNDLIIDDSLLESLQKENNNDLLKITDEVLNNSLDNLPKEEFVVDDLLNDLPLENDKKEESLDGLLEELPKNDDLLENILEDNSKEESLDSLLEELPKNDDLLNDLPELNNEKEEALDSLLEELPKNDNNLLDNLPEINNNEEINDDLLLNENNLDDLMGNLESSLPNHEELVKFDNGIVNNNQTNDLLATLTNGFTMDFLDEPVMQKVKTR